MAGPGNILIKIGADAGQAVSELGGLEKSLGATMSGSEKMAAGLHKAAVPAAAALTGIAVAAGDAAKAAAEDAQAAELLAGALKRTTGATDAQVAATEDYITQLSFATGVADDELRPAMSKLATATGDVGKAQDAMTIALDVSAQSGKSLESVSMALAKGYGGQTTAINRLVPGLDQTIIKSGDMTAVMAELARVTGGAATDAANTAAGQYEIFGIKMQELKETLGASLLPVLEQLIGMMNQAADFAAEHTTAIKTLVGAVAALSAGILAANAVMKVYHGIQATIKVATAAWTAAQWLLNAALNANPVGLVVTAVAALAAGLVIAWQHSETFRNVVTAAFDAVKSAADALGRAFTAVWNAAKSAFDWIMSNWQRLAPLFGPIGVALGILGKHFDEVKAIAVAAFNAIKGAIDAVWGAIQSVISAIGNLIDWIKKIPSKIDLPSIPNPFLAPAGATHYGATAGASSSGAGVTVNVYGAVDPEGTARAIRAILAGSDRRMGRNR